MMRLKIHSLLQTRNMGLIHGKLIKKRFKYKKVLLFTFVIILTGSTPITYTQATLQPTIAWEQTYGGSGTDIANSMIQTADGGFVLAGYTTSPEFGGEFQDAWLIKVNSKGGGLWSTRFGGPDNDRVEAVIQTADGGFAVAGSYVKSYGEQGELGRSADAWLSKTNANGKGEWSQTYGRFLLFGQKDDVAYSLIQTPDGGFVLAGYTGCYGAGKKDMWLIKTDSNGNPQWNQTYGGSEDDIAYAIIQTTGGGFILAGSTDSYGAGKSDVWLVKTSPNGNEEWNRVYGESGADVANTMIQTTDGGYALAGWTNSTVEDSPFPFPPPPSLPKTDALLMKTDANGDIQWTQTYRDISPQNKAFSVIETTNGGLIFAGQTGMDAWLVKTDANGNMEWNQTYGGPGLDSANAIIQTPDGGYAFTGSFFSSERVADFWLVKTNPESLPIIPIISPIVPPPLTITTTSEPVSTSEIPPETTSETTSETSPSTTMESTTEKVTKEEEEAAGIPGFVTFPSLLALIVVVLVFRKHQK